jgi:predicted DNA-binding helix-hairpin-helix protein
LYGFAPDEITPEQEPNLAADMDPKAAWALRNLDLFPVEVNKADFEMLIRVPGIGIIYARKIIQARTYCNITHDILRKIGIPLKKSGCFITCQGRYIGEGAFNEISMRLLLSDANDAQ